MEEDKKKGRRKIKIQVEKKRRKDRRRYIRDKGRREGEQEFWEER